MMHEAAIEAARRAMCRDDLDPTAEEVARCVATFLREWEPTTGDADTSVAAQLCALETADELEGK